MFYKPRWLGIHREIECKKMKKVLLLLALVLIASSLGFSQENKETDKKQDLTAEDIVARHLASIGTPENIAAVKSRVLIGQGSTSSQLGNGSANGPAQFASTDNMLLLAMIFNTSNYPYEKLAYDGKTQTFGRPNGGTTLLSAFLKSQKAVLNEGWFGGVLSSSWPLLDLKGKKIKLEYGGLVKTGERQFYKLKYSSSGEMKVFLYFDSETYRHVVTEYRYSVDFKVPLMTAPAGGKTYYSLTEQFSDFTTAGKLTLPLSYSINATTQLPTLGGQGGGTNSADWKIKFANVYYDEPLDAAVFKVS
jgi:hypothetical protein